MKNFVICALALVAFSCSSNPKVAESKTFDRSMASQEHDEVIKMFQMQKFKLDAAALKIQQDNEKKISDVENSQPGRGCSEDFRLKRAFTNACTDALAICKKISMDPFNELYLQFRDLIYGAGLDFAEEADRNSQGNGDKNRYGRLRKIAELYNGQIRGGIKILIDNHNLQRSFGMTSHTPRFGNSDNETADNKDNYVTCINTSKLLLREFYDAKPLFDSIIPH